jgi:DNA replication protein DnaC
MIDAVVDIVKKELTTPGTLFVFGAYGVGKERVYMAVAKELNMKVRCFKA